MDYLPICIDVRARRCLVVGGGAVAARKADLLVRAGADVVVVATALGDAVRALGDADDARLIERPFEESDLDDVALVIAATDEPTENHTIAAAAKLRGLWVNVVDDPAHCSFVLPAIVDRDPVLVAVSSSARSPVLARHVRGRIEALLPHRLGELAVLLGSYRQRVKDRLATLDARRRFWEGIVEGPVADLVHAGKIDDATAALDTALDAAGDDGARAAVFAVAVTDPDPDRLTFRMLRLLQRAEIVAHAPDVPAAIVDLSRRDAHRVEVPAGDGDAVARQLLSLTTGGQRVCWLTTGACADTLRQLAPAEVDVVLG